MKLAAPNAIFLHCLPAHRGEEVSADVIEGRAIAGVGRGREPTARAESAARHLDGMMTGPMAESTPSAALKRTPLHDVHVALGAKMVPFAGFEMPVHYPAGISAEHKAVRERVGVFDVSHMGEFEVTGPDRNAFVQRVTCNDVAALQTGQAQYSGLLTEQGTFVDDCLVYRFDDKLMLVVNAVEHHQGLGAHRRPEGRGQRPAARHLRRDGAARDPGAQRRGPARRPDPGRGGRHPLLPLHLRHGRRDRSASSPAPATPGRTASSCTAAPPTRPSSGRRSPAAAPSRAASARATRCGSRPGCRSTATTSTTRPPRSRPGSASSSSWTSGAVHRAGHVEAAEARRA